MKKIFLSIMASFLIIGSSFGADPDVKVPDIKIMSELKVKPGRLLRIKVETTSKIIKWYVLPEDSKNLENFDLIPMESTKEAIFSSPVAGKYRVLVYCAAGDIPSDPKVSVITVDGASPDPNPPGPVVDPFFQSLNKAYQNDSSPTKAEKLPTLVAQWKNAATKTVFDPEIKTTGNLLSVLHAATSQLIDNNLMGVRDAIRVELDSKLTKQADAQLDDATRKLIATQFERVAETLSKVK